MVVSANDLAQHTATPLEFERTVLAELNAAIGYDCAFFFTLETTPTAVGLPRAFEETVATPAGAKYEREMLPVKAAALARRGVALDTEVLGAARHECAYFRDFAAPVGGRHSLLAYVRLRGEVIASVMLGRCRDSFREREVEAVADVLPSLAVARASFGLPRARALDALSPRERELVQYLCLGYTNREMASACGTSVNTVRNQLSSAFSKLGASTRAEAVGIVRG